MSAIKNLKTNIPVKARVMLIMTILFAVVLVSWGFSRAFSEKETAESGVAELAGPPTERQISKDTPLAQALYDDESEVGKIYRADEQARAQQARTTNNMSHLDGMRIQLKDPSDPLGIGFLNQSCIERLQLQDLEGITEAECLRIEALLKDMSPEDRERFLKLLRSLSPEDRAKLLALLEQMSPEDRSRLLKLLESMSPEDRSRLLKLLSEMSPEERSRLLKLLESMSPEDRSRLLKLLESMSPEDRSRLLKLLESMSPEDRSRLLKLLSEMSPEERSKLLKLLEGMSPEDRAKLLKLLEEMSPEDRAKLLNLLMDMSPEDRSKLLDALMKLSPKDRALLLDTLMKMGKEERSRFLNQIAGMSADELARLLASKSAELGVTARNVSGASTAPMAVPRNNDELQKLLEQRRIQQEARQREAQIEAQKRNQASNSGQPGVGGLGNGPGGGMFQPNQPNPWQQFIDGQAKVASDHLTAAKTAFSELKTTNGRAAKPIYFGSGGSGGGEAAGGSATAGAAGGAGGVTVGSDGRMRPAWGSESYQEIIAERQKVLAERSRGTGSSAGGQSGQNPVFADYTAATPAKSTRYDYPSERLAALNRKTQVIDTKINVGEMYYGMLQIGVNTDEISPIRATIFEKGKLEGAVLIGNPARTGEKAILGFDKLSINGINKGVKVVALDPETLRSGIADNVDRHTMERYMKLFLASFVDGFAEGLAGGQTTTNTDGSKSTIVDKLPDPKDQALVGLGKVGQRFIPIFEKEFGREPTVTVEPNKMILLMFMEEADLKQ